MGIFIFLTLVLSGGKYEFDTLISEKSKVLVERIKGQIYFLYSNFGDGAHAELLKENNSLNHAPLPRHHEVPLRHLHWSLCSED